MFGMGGMSNSIRELEDAPYIFAIGTNTTESHPVIALRIKKAVKKGARLVVADPRRIDLVQFAERYLPIKVGSDLALLSAMAQVIIEEGLQKESFLTARSEGFAEYSAHVALLTPEWAAPICGIDPPTIRAVARDYASAERAAICYTLGITEHACGVANVEALGNLALLTGNLGRRASGVNPFRGQNNVQGTGDMGCMPESLPGYLKVANPDDRAAVSRVWNLPVSAVPGMKKPEVVEAALGSVHAAGKRVHAMWVVGDNTVVADTDPERTTAAFRALDFLVVQDIFLTETARLADVVFPAAASFAEVDGTFTNSDRHVQRVRKIVEPPGEARADWWIIREVARRMGHDWTYETPSEIWDEAASIAPILHGINYARLEHEQLAWPCPDVNHPGTPFLHEGTFKSGRGKFMSVSWQPIVDGTDEDYPLVLTTGRRLSTYHTGTQTRRARHFDRIQAHEQVEVNPVDAAALDLTDGAMVEIASRRGAVRAVLKVTDRSPRGTVFMTFHFPEETLTNLLSSTALDPLTLTPEFKACAVRIGPA
ncbi:MAG: formate dehydrogenase subunit alpha [Myxococcales bacterium]|nr:formate dehydrogenase subunit alpha [Myxococcales bacterium]